MNNFNLKQVLSDEEILIAKNTNVEQVAYVALDKNTKRISYFAYTFYTQKVADEATKVIARTANEKAIAEGDIVRVPRKTITLEEYIKQYVEMADDIYIARIVFDNFMKEKEKEN
nr:MAG TPA: hypothetical protein [Caudoviricetes sp.]